MMAAPAHQRREPPSPMTLTGERPRPLLRGVNGTGTDKVLGRKPDAGQERPLLKVVPKTEGPMHSAMNASPGMNFFGEGPLRSELNEDVPDGKKPDEKQAEKRSVGELMKDPKYREWAQDRSQWM